MPNPDLWNPVAVLIYGATGVALYGLMMPSLMQASNDPSLRAAYSLKFAGDVERVPIDPDPSGYFPGDEPVQGAIAQVSAPTPGQLPILNGGYEVDPSGYFMPDSGGSGGGTPSPDYTISASRLKQILAQGGGISTDGCLTYPVPFTEAFAYLPPSGSTGAIAQVSTGEMVTFTFQADHVVCVR